MPFSCRFSYWTLSLAVLFTAHDGATAATPSHLLSCAAKSGDLTRVELTLEVGGDVKLSTGGKTSKLPMSVVANLNYEEQLLQLSRSATEPSRSARHYSQAKAVIKLDKGGEEPELRSARRLIQVETADGTNTLFSPQGSLTREELDLIDTMGNSLLVEQLLPNKSVKLGDSWKHADQTIAALLGLDAVSFTDVQSVLGEIKGDKAKIALAGTVNGAAGGVGTEIEIKAKYSFDLKLKRITWFAMLVKEKRAIGHVSPGLDVVAKLTMKIAPLDKSEHLTAEAVAGLPKKPSPELLLLSYEAPSRQFQFNYDRRWYATSDEANLLVMRMVDRGELLAQCNVSLLPNLPADKQPNLEKFQDDIEKSLGKSFGQFVRATQAPSNSQARVLRVIATGEVSQLPIQWMYYHVSNEKGQQVALAFTLESNLLERMGSADEDLVASLRLTEPELKTARKTPAVKADLPAAESKPQSSQSKLRRPKSKPADEKTIRLHIE